MAVWQSCLFCPAVCAHWGWLFLPSPQGQSIPQFIPQDVLHPFPTSSRLFPAAVGLTLRPWHLLCEPWAGSGHLRGAVGRML